MLSSYECFCCVISVEMLKFPAAGYKLALVDSCLAKSITSPVLQDAARSRTAATSPSFALLSLVLRVGLGQVFARHQVHDGGAAELQPERAQRHVAVQKAALVDQAQNLRLGYRLF